MLKPVTVVQVLHIQQLSIWPNTHLFETVFLGDVGAAMGHEARFLVFLGFRAGDGLGFS
jgi:hypothetical protein